MVQSGFIFYVEGATFKPKPKFHELVHKYFNCPLKLLFIEDDKPKPVWTRLLLAIARGNQAITNNKIK